MSSPLTQSPHRTPLGCQFLIYLSVTGFFILMAIVLIPALRDGIASAVHCPSAAQVVSETSSGGYVNRTSTTITTMTCTFADHSEKIVGNDTIFLTAVGVGVAASMVVTLVAMPLMNLYGWLNARGRRAS
jgi:hypothetical protein